METKNTPTWKVDEDVNDTKAPDNVFQIFTLRHEDGRALYPVDNNFFAKEELEELVSAVSDREALAGLLQNEIALHSVCQLKLKELEADYEAAKLLISTLHAERDEYRAKLWEVEQELSHFKKIVA